MRRVRKEIELPVDVSASSSSSAPFCHSIRRAHRTEPLIDRETPVFSLSPREKQKIFLQFFQKTLPLPLPFLPPAVQRVEKRIVTDLSPSCLKVIASSPPPGEEFINRRRSSLSPAVRVAKQPLPLHQFSHRVPSLDSYALTANLPPRYRYGQLEKFGGNDRGDYHGLLRIKMEIDGGKMEGGWKRGIPRRVLRSDVPATLLLLLLLLLFRTWSRSPSLLTPEILRVSTTKRQPALFPKKNAILPPNSLLTFVSRTRRPRDSISVPRDYRTLPPPPCSPPRKR